MIKQDVLLLNECSENSLSFQFAFPIIIDILSFRFNTFMHNVLASGEIISGGLYITGVDKKRHFVRN